MKKHKTKPFFSKSLAFSMLAGALIAFALIAFFVYGVDNPDPDWGRYWMIRPLVIVPFAGAVGGGFFYWMERQGFQNGVRVLSMLISFIVYIIGLWIGFVLGLDGTLWD